MHMESVKELVRGLMGIHILDEGIGDPYTPTQLRKWLGIFVLVIFGLHLAGVLAMILMFSIQLFINGQWLGALTMPFLGLFCVGIYTIPGWVFIDWEKNRLKAMKLNPQ